VINRDVVGPATYRALMNDAVRTPLPDLVAAGVTRTLQLAATWLRWDGTPCIGEDPARIYTPHKAVRRYTDHLLDHLAQIECLAAGIDTVPDEWRASSVTFETDWAHFSEADLAEARQRLMRLGCIYRVRLQALGASEWDRDGGGEWTIRQIVEHVADAWYAEQVGDLRRDHSRVATASTDNA
jgi:hypothetical protein